MTASATIEPEAQRQTARELLLAARDRFRTLIAPPGGRTDRRTRPNDADRPVSN